MRGSVYKIGKSLKEGKGQLMTIGINAKSTESIVDCGPVIGEPTPPTIEPIELNFLADARVWKPRLHTSIPRLPARRVQCGHAPIHLGRR